MSEQGYGKITGSSCSDCIHQFVCCHKNDFDSIRKAVADAAVCGFKTDGKVSTKRVIHYDILDEIVIKCRRYYDGSEIRIDSNGMTFRPYPRPNLCDCSNVSVASDTPNSVTTISNATQAKIDPPSNFNTTTDYIFR